MAQFLSTIQIIAEIENIIKKADEKLILISPFLKLAPRFEKQLLRRNKKGKETIIICKKHEPNCEEIKKLQKKFEFLKIMYLEDIHAKCYLNDNKVIITSLNLYKTDDKTKVIFEKDKIKASYEMGVLIDMNNQEDKVLFENTIEEVDTIIEDCEKAKIGYCIKKGTLIPYNEEKPFSYDACKEGYSSFDKNVGQKYCHFSGEESNGETSLANPVLEKYILDANEVHGF